MSSEQLFSRIGKKSGRDLISLAIDMDVHRWAIYLIHNKIIKETGPRAARAVPVF